VEGYGSSADLAGSAMAWCCSIFRAREAEIPAPLAFPWRRALPGLVLVAVGLLAGLALLVGALVSAPASEPVAALTAPAWLSPGRFWLAATLAGSLLVSWLVVRLSRTENDTVL
jgi:hypothetical protein